jgi:hypothetical protein
MHYPYGSFQKNPKDYSGCETNKNDAAAVLVLIVLNADQYVRIKPNIEATGWDKTKQEKAIRFFKILQKLSFELKSLLSNINFASSSTFVPSKLFEVELRKLLWAPLFRPVHGTAPPPDNNLSAANKYI